MQHFCSPTDGTNRPVGRRGPQQSPFRSTSSNTEIANSNTRRPNGEIRGQNGRTANPTRNRPQPQPTRNRPEPQPSKSRPQTQRNPRVLLPAIPISFKYTRPTFDVLGKPLVFKEITPEQGDVLPDFRDPKGTRNRGNNRKTTRRPKTSNLGPDLRPKLPIFGQPDLILKATEELRNSDVNQNAIISLGKVNAGKRVNQKLFLRGDVIYTHETMIHIINIYLHLLFPGVLPLATENEQDQQLGFFPPFNVRKIQPK